MDSKRRPKSHSKSQRKKKFFTMETIFDRFPTLGDVIFEYLDAKSLANCVEVNKKWQSTIGNQKVYLKMKILNFSKHCNNHVRKEWRMALVKTPLELYQNISWNISVLFATLNPLKSIIANALYFLQLVLQLSMEILTFLNKLQ